MRLRCPERNCPLDLPDELLGQSARCPHCGCEFVVASRHRDLTLDEEHDAESDANDATPIEHRLYDGLPPLSVMLAIRAGRPLDDRAAEAMTDDDWKALSAFESALAAVTHISTALWLGSIAVAMHLFFAVSRTLELHAQFLSPTARELGEFFAVPIAIGSLLFALRKGRSGIMGARTDQRLPRLVPWLAFIGMLAFAGATIWLIPTAFSDRDGTSFCLRSLVVLFDFVAIAPWAVASWTSLRAIERLSPPEIAKRLQDALAYLK